MKSEFRKFVILTMYLRRSYPNVLLSSPQAASILLLSVPLFLVDANNLNKAQVYRV